MCNNSVGEQGAKAIGQALSQNPTLHSLNLRLNRLQDEGGEAIARALLRNSTLCHLHLGANELTGRSAMSLAKALLQNSTLRSLNLSCNTLGVVRNSRRFYKSTEDHSTLRLCVCVCVQDGGKALQEAMSCNTSLQECDIRLTEIDEDSASFIKQVVWSNRR